MANISGQAYGLTILSPIIDDVDRTPSHAAAIREVLSSFDSGGNSPLAKVTTTHLARFAVMDDVFFQGAPAHEDHLKSKYLLFTSNFDGSLDDYLDLLAATIPDEIDAIWSHCVGFPGAARGERFRDYMKKCQIDNGIFFGDYGESTVDEVMIALHTQRRFVDFMIANQGVSPSDLQNAFRGFMSGLTTDEIPRPGTV